MESISCTSEAMVVQMKKLRTCFSNQINLIQLGKKLGAGQEYFQAWLALQPANPWKPVHL